MVHCIDYIVSDDRMTMTDKAVGMWKRSAFAWRDLGKPWKTSG
jgi:hypothetical protein